MRETSQTSVSLETSAAGVKPVVAAENACHTASIGNIRGFAKCLNEGLASCPYRKPFGYGHLCYHPDWRQFASSSTP